MTNLRATARRVLRAIPGLLLVVNLASQATAEPPPGGLPDPDCSKVRAQVASMNRFLGKLPSAIGGALERVLVTDPEKQLEPGDILVYPFHDSREREGERRVEEQPEQAEAPSEPEAYRAALKGFGHAAIVARDPAGKLFHLDSPHAPDFVGREFGGSRPFYVVRPKTPPGLTRDEFEKKVNAAANCIQRIGFDYDPLMQMDFLDEKKLAGMKSVVENCPAKREPGKASPFPPQFCSELTQTVLAIAGAPTARPATAAQLVDLAIESVKTKGPDGKAPEGKALEKAVEQAADDVIRMFTFGMEDAAKRMEETKKEMEKEIAQRKLANENTTAIESDLKGLSGHLAGIRRELLTYTVAKTMLRTIAAKRLRGEKADIPLLGNVLEQKVVRPYDILAEGLKGDGDFRLSRFYPGHLPECEPPPLPDDAEIPPGARGRRGGGSPPPARARHD